MEIEVDLRSLVASIDENDILAAAHMIAGRLSPNRRISFLVNQLMTERKERRREILREVGVIPHVHEYDEINRKIDGMIELLENM